MALRPSATVSLGYPAHAPTMSARCSSGSSPSFLVGSTASGHEACALVGPSSRANATGLGRTDSSSGDPYSTSVWVPPPLFNSSMSLADAAYASYSNKFVSYAYPALSSEYLLPHSQPSSSALTLDSLQSSNMAIPLQQPISEPILDSTSREPPSPPPGDYNEAEQSEVSTDRKHACWMCHKAFDR